MKELNLQDNNKTATVIAGNLLGSKVIVKDNGLYACSNNRDFWETILPEINQTDETKLIEVKEQKVFIEPVKSYPKLVICGGGHISIPVIQMANMLEFSVTVLEDRPMFANNARKANAANVICEPFDQGLDQIAGDENTYFVIVTRGHRYDALCLEKILQKKHGYIGMIGSRVRVKAVKDLMLEKGFTKEETDTIYSPIGLNIKAETPAEIGVAIMAEIIQVKNEKAKGSGYTKEILDFLKNSWSESLKYAMVTITKRKGSAPRTVGTKMIVGQDGCMIGTIGGGCAEASIRGLSIESINKNQPILTTVDMTGKEAEEDGMVCGGVIEVFIEPW